MPTVRDSRTADSPAKIKRLRSLPSSISDVGNMVTDAAENARLREAIRRLADQDATLSVCNGSVAVYMDATLSAAEREAIDFAADFLDGRAVAETLRNLLERLA